MRLIGGLVFWDAERPATAPELRGMSGAPLGAPVTVLAAERAVGLFGSSGDCHIESTPAVCLIADLELTNTDELAALVGPERRQIMLATLYERHGPAFLNRLQGAFVLAVWDCRQRTLLLAVDRVGVKRLYYASDSVRTAFASTASAVVAAPDAKAAVEPSAVLNYLSFGFVPAPGSIFSHVHRVAPGHSVIVGAGGTRVARYWDVVYAERQAPQSEYEAALSGRLNDAVARALSGTDPAATGAYLSGGTDSSTVLGLMARQLPHRPPAFSIGFREERWDEMRYARLSARHFGVEHVTCVVGAARAFRALPRLVDVFDEPFANNSAIGTFFCADIARAAGARHLLAGDGGDELFGGNDRYVTDAVFARYASIPGMIRRYLIEPILDALPAGGDGTLGRAQRYVRRANLPNPRRFYSYEFFFTPEAADLLTADFLSTVDGERPDDVIARHYRQATATSELNRLLYLDLKLTLGDNDLLKVTRTADVHGIKVRFPMLDTALIEFAATLPAGMKLRGLEQRYLFKRALRDLLPAETLAKRKHGFGVPTSLWLKTDARFRELLADTLLAPRARQRDYLRPQAVETLIARHMADQSPFYGDILWALLMLELWHRRHLDHVPAI